MVEMSNVIKLVVRFVANIAEAVASCIRDIDEAEPIFKEER
jgi:hypothetical protein